MLTIWRIERRRKNIITTMKNTIFASIRAKIINKMWTRKIRLRSVLFNYRKKTRQKSEKKNKFAIISSFNCETVLLCDVTNNEKDFFFFVPCSAIKEKISQKVPQSTENKICSETQENLKLFRKMIVYITSSSCTNQNRCSISYITLN